jgi:hypothetical protein
MITVTSRAVRAKLPCSEGWKQYMKASGKTEVDDEEVPLSKVLKDVGFENTLFVIIALPQHNELWRSFVLRCSAEAEEKAFGIKSTEFAHKAKQAANQDNVAEAMLIVPQLAAQSQGWSAFEQGHPFKEAVAHARERQIKEFIRIVDQGSSK